MENFVVIKQSELEQMIFNCVNNALKSFKGNIDAKSISSDVDHSYYTWDDCLNTSEVADLFKIDKRSVQNWIKSKKLNPVTIGNKNGFVKEEVYKLFEEKK